MSYRPKKNKMKHYSQLIALLVALLPACATLSAQELHTSPFHDDDHEHGLFVGGAATYWNNNKTNTSTLQLFPEAGWRFNRTWAAGVMLGYEIGNDGWGLRFAPEEVMIGLELEF